MRQVIFSALLCAAGQAQAGPWLQAEGTGFLSFALETVVSDAEEDQFFGTGFMEYGVSENITFGIDAGGSEGDLYKAIFFAKAAPFDRDGNNDIKVAVEFGIGISDDEMTLRPGFSIGRGFPLGQLSGWMSIDTLAYVQVDSEDVDVTTDFTFGVNMSERTKLILQLQSGHELTELDFAKFAPSVVYEYKPGQHIELGMLAGLENADDLALKLGLWQKF